MKIALIFPICALILSSCETATENAPLPDQREYRDMQYQYTLEMGRADADRLKRLRPNACIFPLKKGFSKEAFFYWGMFDLPSEYRKFIKELKAPPPPKT